MFAYLGNFNIIMSPEVFLKPPNKFLKDFGKNFGHGFFEITWMRDYIFLGNLRHNVS